MLLLRCHLLPLFRASGEGSLPILFLFPLIAAICFLPGHSPGGHGAARSSLDVVVAAAFWQIAHPGISCFNCENDKRHRPFLN